MAAGLIFQKMNDFKGMGVALATPFADDGTIDFRALQDLVETQISGGADFLCVLGTTAETPTLDPQEKRDIIAMVRYVAAGRVPLLLGCGGNNTATVIDYLRAEDLSGISGVLIVTPYYNKPSQEGLFRHFKAVAEASPLPVVLYNVPGRTGVNLSAETTLRIAGACPNVVGIKEASGNLDQIAEIVRRAPEGFSVISGDDALTCEIIARGGVGVISVIGNALPQTFSTLVHDALAGHTDKAWETNRRLERLYSLMTVDGNPAGIKSLLTLQGKISNVLRLPLVPVRSETQKSIAKALSLFTNTL